MSGIPGIIIQLHFRLKTLLQDVSISVLPPETQQNTAQLCRRSSRNPKFHFGRMDHYGAIGPGGGYPRAGLSWQKTMF